MNLLDALSGADSKFSAADILSTPPPQRKRSRLGTPFTPPIISQDDQNRLTARIKHPKLMLSVLDVPDATSSASQPAAAPTSIQRPLVSGKTFNCLVHGMVSLEPICVQIIDSPPFQRLHNLKQLGTSDYVFRGATHTRFEHSIGVAHLAGQMASALQQNQPELNITDEDILCVKIAGLCHDLGEHVYLYRRSLPLTSLNCQDMDPSVTYSMECSSSGAARPSSGATRTVVSTCCAISCPVRA